MPWDALKPAIVSQQSGASEQEIEEEPNWRRGHDHRIGFLNRQGRFAGLTHDGDYDPYETAEDREFRNEAQRKYRDLREKSKKGQLVNFQDVMKAQTVRCFKFPLRNLISKHHGCRTSTCVSQTTILLASVSSFKLVKIG